MRVLTVILWAVTMCNAVQNQKTEAADFYMILVTTNNTMCHIPEDHNLKFTNLYQNSQ